MKVQIPGRGENQTKANQLKEKIRRNVASIRERIDDLKLDPKPKVKKPARPPPKKPIVQKNARIVVENCFTNAAVFGVFFIAHLSQK